MRRPRQRSITIHDVAKTAGVSVSTVSRVLNEKDDVAPETYDKVKEVINEMGYASSLAARSMRSRKTDVIGLIIPDVQNPFPVEVMRGVNRAIAELDYDLIAYTYGNIRKNSSADRERHYVSLLGTSITDGVIIVTPRATEFTTSAPVVAVDPNNESPSCPAVIATNRVGAISAMEYLLGLGHRRIGHITGRKDLQSAIRRLQGYEDALNQAGIPLEPGLIQQGDFSTETAMLCARNLLTMENPPTAIFAANDQSAIGVIRVARELGLRVPEDISVIGFDNIPEAEHLNLTTVDQFINEMGFVATKMLIRLIHGEELDTQLYKMPTQLIIRGSCRALS